jgi:predicted GIY-YIG superfamily endonuclease
VKFVYLLKLSESGYYKIGHTNNINKRIKELSTGNPEEIVLISKYSSKYYKEIENYLHNIHKFYNIKGEWFNLDIEDELKFIDNCKLCEKNHIYLELNKI